MDGDTPVAGGGLQGRRLRRAVAVVLCCAPTLLGVGSFVWSLEIGYGTRVVAVVAGGLDVGSIGSPPAARWWMAIESSPPFLTHEWWRASRWSRADGGEDLFVPLWPLVPAMAAYVVVVWRRTRPVPAGACASCRYDLTGNVSGICPECGTPIRATGESKPEKTS